MLTVRAAQIGRPESFDIVVIAGHKWRPPLWGVGTKQSGSEKVAIKMFKDIAFLVALITGIASAVAATIMAWQGNWIELAAFGFAFWACIVIAFWLAMTALLKNLKT